MKSELQRKNWASSLFQSVWNGKNNEIFNFFTIKRMQRRKKTRKTIKQTTNTAQVSQNLEDDKKM